MTEDEAFDLERRLWLGGPDLYDDMLDQGCLMAFAGVGILDRTRILQTLRDMPRWSDVTMRERHFTRPDERLSVLGYKAEARRAGEAPYTALCLSTYRRTPGGWRLLQHQQTALDSEKQEQSDKTGIAAGA